MSGQVFLGIDIGSASVRAGLFDTNGQRLAFAVRPIQQFHPKPLFVEQSSTDIWTQVCAVVREAVTKAAIDPASGISADNLTKVFQPFFTTREKGTGLGLALTRKILEDHDGSVSIDSTLGLGTTVTLRWPFRPDLPKPEMIIPEGWLG